MAEIKLSGNKKVSTLCKEFQETFGCTLRVYNGRSLADENNTLSAIRKGTAKGGTLTVNGNMLVGNFEKKVKEMYGIRVQVANVDNSKLADNNITIAAAGRNLVKDENTQELKCDKEPKKHRYVIRVQGVMMQMISIELPNATHERVKEIFENGEPFADYVVYPQGHGLWCDVDDVECGDEDTMGEEVVETLKELAGEVSRENTRCSELHLVLEEDHKFSLLELLELNDHKRYKEICDDIVIESSQDLQLSLGCNLEQNIYNSGLEGEEIELLSALYKNNGYDDSYNLSFMNERCTFEKNKWYLVSLEYSEIVADDFCYAKEYILETDEEFDSKKLVCTYTTVPFDEYNSFLSGLFYDGKQLSVYEEGTKGLELATKRYVSHIVESEHVPGLVDIDESFPEIEY